MRYEPGPQGLWETRGEYYDRLDREEAEFNRVHAREIKEESDRFTAEMREAYGEEYPGQWEE